MMQAQAHAQAWRARPVGSAASDIDLVFDRADRPGTVTALLAACVSGADGQAVQADEAWSWTLSQRLQALLAMRVASGDVKLDLQSSCVQCGEAMEIGLDLRDFAGEPAAPRFTWRSDDGVELALRLPNGRDLQRWMSGDAEASASHETLAASLIESVSGIATGTKPPALATLLPQLDEAFEAHDPLTALHLRTSCPACAHDNTLACDLESMLIDGFARAQFRMLDDVWRLAQACHWSEAEILALPRWRREHYLSQITQGSWM
jgi:hypothetical protein